MGSGKVNLLNRCSLYLGYSVAERNQILEVLEVNQIPYEIHNSDACVNRSKRGERGSFGERTEYQTVYEVFVRKKDYEKSVYLLEKVKEKAYH